MDSLVREGPWRWQDEKRGPVEGSISKSVKFAEEDRPDFASFGIAVI